MLANILEQNNVNISGVRYDSNARTALAFVTLRADGEREFLFFRHPSADMLLHESELDTNIIKQVFSLVLPIISNIKSTNSSFLTGFTCFATYPIPNYTSLAGQDLPLWIYKFNFRALQVNSSCGYEDG